VSPSALAPTLDALLLIPGLVHGAVARTPPPRIPTGLAELDDLLGGGFPRGALTEIVGRPSSGRTTLACALLRAVTARHALAACIDLPDAFDAPYAEAAGVDLGRILWIRPRTPREALQAAEHVIAAEGFGVVLLDLDGRCALHPVATSMWLRLTRAALRTRTAVVVLGRERVAGTFATLRLETERRRSAFDGSNSCPLFSGIASTVRLRKNKLSAPTVPLASLVVAVGS
jgi:hypothetical protein